MDFMKDYRLNEPLISEPDSLRDKLKVFKAGTLFSAVVALSAATLGSGVLALPYAVSNCGIALALIIMLVALASFTVAYHIIIQGLILTRKNTYATMVEALFPSCMRFILELCIVVELFGVVCAYQSIIVEFTQSIMLEVFGVQKDFFLLLNLVVTGLLCLGSLKHQMTSLSSVTSLVILSILYITLLVIVQTPSYVRSSPSFWSYFAFFKVDFRIFDTVTLLCFSFNSITRLPMIFDELEKKTYSQASRVIKASLSSCTLLFLALGGFGYVSYNYNMPELVLDRPSQGMDWPMVVGKILFTVGLTANSVQTLYPLRGNIEEAIMGTEFNFSSVRFWTINFATIFLIGLVAVVFNDVVGYFKIIGGFAVIPSAILYPMFICWVCSKNRLFIACFSFIAVTFTAFGMISVFQTILHK